MQLSALRRGGGTNITRNTSFNIVVKSALPTDKSFSELTDSELLQIVQALDNNLITTADLNWQVGDSRDVQLSSFTSYPSGSASTQAAQTAQLVIMNVGGKTFNGNGTSLDGKTVHYVVGFKDNVALSYYHSSSGVYANSLLRTVENNVYKALPSDVKACFKKFDVVTGTYSGGSSSGGNNTTTQQYFTSAAEKEIFGYIHGSTSNEVNALSHFTYYATTNNRVHTNLNNAWWERSPNYSNSNNACLVSSGATSSYTFVYIDYGVSPYGCI